MPFFELLMIMITIPGGVKTFRFFRNSANLACRGRETCSPSVHTQETDYARLYYSLDHDSEKNGKGM